MPTNDTLLIFDLDNTLIDTSESYWRIKDAMLEHELLEHMDKKELDKRYEAHEAEGMKHWGHAPLRLKFSMFNLYNDLIRDGSIKRSEELERVMNEAGDELHKGPYPKLLPGAKDLVAKTQKIVGKQIIVTQGDEELQQVKVTKRGLRKFFNEVIAVPRKDAKVFRDIIEARNVYPENVCVVGDSARSDMTPALEIGAHGILYKFVSPSDVGKKYQATSVFLQREGQGTTDYVEAPTFKDVLTAVTEWSDKRKFKPQPYRASTIDTI